MERKAIIHHIYLVALLGVFSLTSCEKERNDVSEKRVKKESMVDIGARFPELRDSRNDTVYVALYPSAMLYLIDKGLVQSQANIDAIKKAMSQQLPIVRVKVYEGNPCEIAEVYPPTEEDIARYKESLQE